MHRQKQAFSAARENVWRELQTHMRVKRFRFFVSLLAALPRPLTILDVGGTEEFWQKVQFDDDEAAIVIYNLTQAAVSRRGMLSMAGDARDMHEFADQQFDVVFSNSVIEHVGDYEQQRLMAREVQRIGKRYYVQTPNRYFPIEPHVLLPFFQFFPFGLQVFILTHCKSPWGWKIPGKSEAIAYIRAIRLLSEKELRALFPGAHIQKEIFLGLTKSFIVYAGW